MLAAVEEGGHAGTPAWRRFGLAGGWPRMGPSLRWTGEPTELRSLPQGLT